MIRVGTAGFAYKDWEGAVYPAPRPRDFDPLAFLARHFPCIEMNVTFYRVPEEKHVVAWLERTAFRDDFRFAFKLYRGLTHGDEPQALAPFLEALEPCRAAGRLGAILLQFPHYFRNTKPNRARLARLADGLGGWPCAVEVRDRSWTIPPALDFLERLGLSICDLDMCASRDALPPGSWTTGPVGYVRFHGRNVDAWFDRNATVEEKYDYLYSPAELEEWAVRIREIAAQTEFTYVITNNHFGGQAVANAFQLARLLDVPTPDAPAPLRDRFPHLA